MRNNYIDHLFHQIRFPFPQIMNLLSGRLSTKACHSNYCPYVFPKSHTGTLGLFWPSKVLHYTAFFELSYILDMLIYGEYVNN